MYKKITADLETGTVALGGEYYADVEKVLLDQGSRQEDIWGGGVNLETKSFETNAIINLRSGRNDSTDILDLGNRKRFLEIAQEFLKNYVQKKRKQ